jgi:tRNA pseudouridine13 synthase
MNYSYVLGAPLATATLRTTPEDFEVHEVLGFEPDGAGDHALLLIQKRNTNTEWLARNLAKFAGVKQVDVGYGGLKDRNAVTSQWFSVNLSGKIEPDWAQLESAELRVLRVARNRRKLKRGAHHGNHFVITLRDVTGDVSELDTRLQAIRDHGVPNYFGEQRFGIAANNIEQARAMFAGEIQVGDRHRRGLYLSAARSLLFNAILSRRVADQSWNTGVHGDALMLEGTHSFFVADVIDATLAQRLQSGDVHPTGPLWGRGESAARLDARRIEDQVLTDFEIFRTGLEHAGLDQERRALRLLIQKLEWEFVTDRTLRLEFVLPSGAYATTVVRELITTCAPAGA